ncbi:MAG: CDP-alcohol phosphatidyltransferase family protein [Limisphaerales bacterium]
MVVRPSPTFTATCWVEDHCSGPLAEMTLPNQITILRILLVPAFIVSLLYHVHGGGEWLRWLALAVFGLAALSDAVDGFIARRFDQISELGKVLDPLADKMLLVAGFILLSLDNGPYLAKVPIWLTALIFSRDVLLVLGLILIHYTFGSIRVQPRLIGKAATLFQMLIVLHVLAKGPDVFFAPLIYAAGACTAISGCLYIWDGILQLGSHPSSGPIAGSGKDAPPE